MVAAAMTADRDPWFAEWFGEEYLALYPERDDREARQQAIFVRELLASYARLGRMRFLDLEPEEVFANAKQGDQRCREFVDLWHRALAAATASFIHLAGAGRFYFTGHNVGWVDLPTLRADIEAMVKMTSLQSFSLEVLPPDDETALLGAGVSALRALNP